MNDPSTSVSRVSIVEAAWDRGVATIALDLAQPKNSFRAADAARLSAVLDEVLADGSIESVMSNEGRQTGR